MKKLTWLEERFAFAAVTSRNPVNALLAARPGKRRGSWAYKEAEELMKRPHVVARIGQIREDLSKYLQITPASILQEWADIAFADPNELIQYRRNCCRNCYGKNNGYQWVDETEWQDAAHAATLRNAKRVSASLPPETMEGEPPRTGGFGFDRTRPANESCPICMGEGVGEVWLADTSKLTGRASKLYAGVKQTKNGIEVQMRDQDAALRNLAQAFGVIQTGSKDKGEPPPDMAALFNQLVALLPP